VNSKDKVAAFFEKVFKDNTQVGLQDNVEGREREPVAEVLSQDVCKKVPKIKISDNVPSFLKNEKSRLIIFGGKGGTGKTTSSCATAMYLAKKYPGKRFLVISSDPAHSLADSFDCPINNSSVTPVKEVDNLFAMEMNSQTLLEKFKKKYKSSIANFSNMSFATDQIDIRDFLNFKLPGMQEMMILLEIVNLLKFGIFRPFEYDLIIWDTAPTGHTLRLLELPDKVLKWIDIFETSFLRYKRVSVGVAMIGFKISGRTPPKGSVRTFLDNVTDTHQLGQRILFVEFRVAVANRAQPDHSYSKHHQPPVVSCNELPSSHCQL